jgi:hypothetical protein
MQSASWTAGANGTVTIDLANLPGTGTNLLPAMNASGFLDVVVDAHTGVDDASLTLTRAHAPDVVAWIAAQPLDASVCSGGAASFSVTGAGTGPLTYRWQWRQGGGAWADLAEGANSAAGGHQLMVHNTTAPSLAVVADPYFMGQSLSFRCALANSCGSATSNAASLSVQACCGSADFNCDGDIGTDADIESFFACLAGSCPPPPCSHTSDFNGDGDLGTDADIEAFFRVLSGGTC